jgi:hypothetical protein
MRKTSISWTTDASGDASVYGASIFSRVHAIDYLPGTTATGATVTVTCEGAMTTTLLAKTSAGTANTRYYPRVLVHGNTDGAALTGTSGGDREPALAQGRLKVVIAAGGNTFSGSVVIHYE